MTSKQKRELTLKFRCEAVGLLASSNRKTIKWLGARWLWLNFDCQNTLYGGSKLNT
jgi:hypothetical protein